jgi:NIMA (never in mitosis gene a)-related kinase 1/4/5
MQVQKFLGKGSYGSVYRVMRLDDQQVYAVKEADVTKMNQQERQDAANEIRLLASVKHPNIVRYFEAFLDGNWLCIIMEYAQCGDLSHYIRKGKERNVPFPEDVVWSFFIQIMRVRVLLVCMNRVCVLKRG